MDGIDSLLGSRLAVDCLKLIGAFFLALPVAWERQRSDRGMGLRTFPLVAVASCGYVLVATALLGEDTQAQARILQGLMTGMGFIGGGAVLKQSDRVKGTATAASLWTTGVVGAAVGYGKLWIAVLVAAVNFVAMLVLTPVREEIEETKDD